MRISLSFTSFPPLPSSFTPLRLLPLSPLVWPWTSLLLSNMAQAVNASATSLEINEGAVTSTTNKTVENEKSAGVNYTKPEKGLVSASYNVYIGDEDPTDEELHGPNALRRISAPIPWSVYTVAFVELCERFSYYGTQVLCR